MSRVGKKPILIPKSVEVKIEGRKVMVKGPKGELQKEFGPEIKIEIKDNEILLKPFLGKDKSKKIKSLWGLVRALIANMVEGVVSGFEKKLNIEGIGFKTEIVGDELILHIGFSHPKKLRIPEGIDVSTEKKIISISGINKELVGQFSSTIRKAKPVEPYKGKGIKYIDEVVKRKVGKKVTTSMG